ncbi:Protein broad-minded [Eufriesea mexicana]|uniref:Protein broad-minded n=1 Tax=Eufriesea mexicana TaxID=516756 RepID=A0A310SII9_9HYME|nr:Protein broad-minded [Eufriesea mexicana]
MEGNISPNLQKWIKKCLKKEFEINVQKSLKEDIDNVNIAQKIIHSKEMSTLVNSMRTTIIEQSASKSALTLISDSRPQSSFSCISDQTSEDWNSPLNNDECYSIILDKINQNKPAHVRLAGYEILLKSELSNLNNNPIWDSIQKALLDGLIDESRPIFEASLQVHAKLLTCFQSHDVYINLLNAFDAQYHSQKTFEILPTLISGINFKFFLHERVFRVIHLIIRYHEEKLKSARNPDKTIEELIEKFIIFLSVHEFGNATQSKILNVLNIISVLEPHAGWSKKWIVSLATRKMFLTALGKSPSLVQQIMKCVYKGLEELPHSIAISIDDDPMEVIINGNTIETVTYLHCLCFISQLCAYEAGRQLLTENVLDIPFSVSEFLTACLKALNKLSIETLSGVYDVSFNILLLKMVSIPFGLKALVQEPSVFQELIEGSIAPLRMSWTSIEIVNFVSSAAFFRLGYNVIANLAPHVLSTLLSETCFCAFMSNTKGLYGNEEHNYPLNLLELFNDSINPASNCHYLGLLSLNIVIWNLNICLYLLELLNFQNILLDLQNFNTEVTNEEISAKYIDDYTLIRHKIISKTYFVKCKDKEETSKSQEYNLPKLPPLKSNKENSSLETEYDTQLENLLQENKPGLLDSNWNTVLIQLVDQMQKAIPTAEWGENFQWKENISSNTDFWFAEEIHGINLVLYYAEQNNILDNTTEMKEKLQEFINACYAFIQYERPTKFDGFDWFLSTVFIICKGDVDRCKTFITQLIQFPVTPFLWFNLGKVIDKHTKEECAMQYTFMQLVENIVSNELPHLKFALKNTSGMNWSLICNLMVSQCFWGLLPWTQIMHFFAICVLFSPDYIIYYCVSLLYHNQLAIMENITNEKMWPDHMVSI